MELIKKRIRMCRLKKKIVSQITMDEDFIVPDVKPDMEKLVLEDGTVELEEIQRLEERVRLRGKLVCRLLYYPAESGSLQSMETELPFDEIINAPELAAKDYLHTEGELEDLTVEMIHSRKVSVKAILTFRLILEGIEEAAAVTEIESEQPVEQRIRRIRAAQTAVCQKDTFRIREELELSGNQPDMEELLWTQCRLKQVETKPLDGQIRIQGALQVFVIYRGTEEHVPPQWIEKEVPFSGTIDQADAVEEMYPEILVQMGHCQLEIQPDYDGENRKLSLDVVLELDIRLYEEEELSVISDVYTPVKTLIPQAVPAQIDEILVKNCSRTKVSGKISGSFTDQLLQICHVDGAVKLDSAEPETGGLMLEGALCVTALLMTDNDSHPLQSVKGVIPFQYRVEAGGMDKNSISQLTTGLEQLGAVMLGGGEIEIRAVLLFDLLARRTSEEQFITEITEEAADWAEISRLPGIAAYVVQPGDSLWTIAKKFHTSVDSLKKLNSLSGEDIKPGDRLLAEKIAG